MTTPIAAAAPVDRPLWDDDGVGEAEDVADEEEFVDVFVVCGMMVWLKGMRKLNCFVRLKGSVEMGRMESVATYRRYELLHL